MTSRIAKARETKPDRTTAARAVPRRLASTFSPWPTPQVVPILRCACGGGCPRCQSEDESLPIQPKLRISQPGDPYEREADRIADQIMRMPQPDVRLKPT